MGSEWGVWRVGVLQGAAAGSGPSWEAPSLESGPSWLISLMRLA